MYLLFHDLVEHLAYNRAGSIRRRAARAKRDAKYAEPFKINRQAGHQGDEGASSPTCSMEEGVIGGDRAGEECAGSDDGVYEEWN